MNVRPDGPTWGMGVGLISAPVAKAMEVESDPAKVQPSPALSSPTPPSPLTITVLTALTALTALSPSARTQHNPLGMHTMSSTVTLNSTPTPDPDPNSEPTLTRTQRNIVDKMWMSSTTLGTLPSSLLQIPEWEVESLVYGQRMPTHLLPPPTTTTTRSMHTPAA